MYRTCQSQCEVREAFKYGFDGIIAACGNYIEMDGKVIYENNLSADMVQKVIRVLSECKMPVVLEGSTDYWIDDEGFEDDPYVDYLLSHLVSMHI